MLCTVWTHKSCIVEGSQARSYIVIYYFNVIYQFQYLKKKEKIKEKRKRKIKCCYLSVLSVLPVMADFATKVKLYGLGYNAPEIRTSIATNRDLYRMTTPHLFSTPRVEGRFRYHLFLPRPHSLVVDIAC